MATRGIVITPMLEERKNGIYIGENVIDLQTFRKNLLYWDQIVIVNLLNPFVPNIVNNYLKSNNDIKTAHEVGQLKIEDYDVRNNRKTYYARQVAEDFRIGQQTIAYNSTQLYDGYWAIGQSIPRLEVPRNRSVREDVITTKLHNALPVPGPDVSAEEIINFKKDRKDELEKFQDSYDSLYDQVMNSENQQLALQKAVKKLDTSLSEVRQVMLEGNLNPMQMSLETIWTVTKSAFSTFIITGTVFPEIKALPIMASSVDAAFSLNKSRINIPDQLSDKARDFAYLSYVESELNKK